jgi:hypothetical protein
MEELISAIIGVVMFVIALVVVATLTALPLMWVWNCVVPITFPGLVASGSIIGHIEFLHALGIGILSGMVFRSAPGLSSRRTPKKVTAESIS